MDRMSAGYRRPTDRCRNAYCYIGKERIKLLVLVALLALMMVVVLEVARPYRPLGRTGSPPAPPTDNIPATTYGRPTRSWAEEPLQAARNCLLADTPYPIFHADQWASDTQMLRGPEAGDKLRIQTVDTVGASSWLQFGPRYTDGSRPIWGGTMSSVFKLIARGSTFEKVDEVQLPGKCITDCFILADGSYVTCDRGRRSILVLADVAPGDPHSKIGVVRKFMLPEATPGKCAHMTLSYDGWIVWLTNENVFGATPLDFSRTSVFRPALLESEVSHHNSFPTDEQGNIFVVTTARMLNLRFRKGEFTVGWQSLYDFSGTGKQIGRRMELFRTLIGAGGTGSGTTPTLFGTKGSGRLVSVVDGQEPNNLVVFWSDDIPNDWSGIPGLERRIAGRIALPYSTPAGPGFTCENSPVGFGNDVLICQWNGLLPERHPVPGVQKVHWDSKKRMLSIAWTNPHVVMNGVPTLSVPSNLVYSSGPLDGVNRFYALDWETGKTVIGQELPDFRRTIDQGNQSIIDDDRSLYYSGRRVVVRIGPE